MFFSFDGIDGAGKTTQMQLFCSWLRDAGNDVVQCRDPGGTKLGESLRSILLTDDGATRISPLSEMLIYMASRSQLVEEVIGPALQAGKTVVSDRYLLANVVYQGYAGGLDVEQVKRVGAVATQGISPAMTFVLDLDVEQAATRMDRSLDRIEARGPQYQEKVRQGFLQEAKLRPEEIAIVDASRDVRAIQDAICGVASEVISSRGVS